MEKKLIDLSLPISEKSGESVPPIFIRTGHKHGGDIFGKRLAFKKQSSYKDWIRSIFLYLLGIKRISNKSFPNNEFLNMELIKLSTHTGTHFDAPFHFGPMSEGKPSLTVDEIPLEWCFSDGVKLDLSFKKPGEFILERDIKIALEDINYELKPFDIVLIFTGSSKYWGEKRYMIMHSGMSQEATFFLVNKGIKVIGIDAYGFDRPFKNMIDDYFRTKEQKYLFPAHFAGREKAYCHIERLTNLKLLPSSGFKVCCFPINIEKAGAAWVRVVAIIG